MKRTEHQRTRHFNVMLIIFAVAALVATLMALYPDARASQNRHGWWRHGDSGHAMRFCEEGYAGHVGEIGPQLNSWLTLDEKQRALWSNVERQIDQAISSLDEYCNDEGATTMPDRLAQAETLMMAGAAAIRDLRPAFASFYGSLDEKQRRMLDERAARWRH